MRIQVGAISFNVTSGPNDWFWKRVNSGTWETETFRTFDAHIDRNTTVLDVGAWIGATVLYAAQLAKRVIAFEPDPVAFAELTRNLQQNPQITNITVLNAAISDQAGRVKLGVRDRAGDSSSSLLLASEAGWEVDALPLREIVRDAGAPAFLKMDVEGYEFTLAEQLAEILKTSDTTALLALHPHFFGIARKARMGRTSTLRKLSGSLAKRTIGRYEGFAAVREMAQRFEGLRVQDIDGTPLNLSSRAVRALLGQNVSDSGSILVRSRQRG